MFAFYRKVKFAEQKLERAVIPLILALSAGANAEQRMNELGIRYRIGFQAWQVYKELFLQGEKP